MHIAELRISGYRAFGQECTIKFGKGLTVLLGENGSGKSTVVDALRLLLQEDDYGRSGPAKGDFHRSIQPQAAENGVKAFRLDCRFEDLTEDQQVAYLPWLDASDPRCASLHMVVSNQENSRGRLKRSMWGGDSQAAAFEFELLQDAMDCAYLPPLRDAEDRLRAHRGSRLARLLKKLRPAVSEGSEDPLEKIVKLQSLQLEQQDAIKAANRSIRKSVANALGPVLAQDVRVQFAELSFERIVERLQLLFYPKLSPLLPRELFRSLNENSLGYNNMLYLATILAELDSAGAPSYRLLLIEEPEAHLHPQLQTRVLQHLAKLAEDGSIQVVVTTHSPTIAASLDLNALQVLVLPGVGACPQSIAIRECGLNGTTSSFLRRWLDATRSTLMFARGVILVEGLAEALLIPELAKLVLAENAKRVLATEPKGDPSKSEKTPNASADAAPTNEDAFLPKAEPMTLEDHGVSVISLGGVHFRHFVQLYRGDRVGPDGAKGRVPCARLPVRCAGILDCDPGNDGDGKALLPTPEKYYPSKNRDRELLQELESNTSCRMFMNLRTLEYDLALEGSNLSVLCEVFVGILETEGPLGVRAREYAIVDWKTSTHADRARAADWLVKHVEKRKGEFAQALADRLAAGAEMQVPDYIRKAVLWATNKC